MAGASLGHGSTPLLAMNFCLYLIAACLAGWAFNRNFDAQNDPGDGGVGNNVTFPKLPSILLPAHHSRTLIACMVALTTYLHAFVLVHLTAGLTAAAATSLIAYVAPVRTSCHRPDPHWPQPHRQIEGGGSLSSSSILASCAVSISLHEVTTVELRHSQPELEWKEWNGWPQPQTTHRLWPPRAPT